MSLFLFVDTSISCEGCPVRHSPVVEFFELNLKFLNKIIPWNEFNDVLQPMTQRRR